jgi:hypothetical protein
MPYIQRERRRTIDMDSSVPVMSNAGELNYVLTMTCLDYLHQNGKSYQTLNDIAGALTNANLEMYRRVTAPYEDEKMVENGDVY